MTVPFATIPTNLRVPLFYGEVNNSQANGSLGINQRVLIIGQMVAAGTAAPNIPVISAGVGDARGKYGMASMLSNMLESYRANDSFGEVWCLPLTDDGTAAAATNTITITGTPTANGVISLYIGGGGRWGDGTGLYNIPVTTVSTPTTIAAAIVAAITADKQCPVTAANTAGVVTLTAVNKGLAGNDIDVRTNYLGNLGGQYTPAGLTVTIATPQCTGGLVNPVLTTALANCGSTPFDFIVMPYTDTTSLNALDAFLNAQTGRWSWSQQIYGAYFAAARGTFGTLTTLGAARNSQYGCILGIFDTPTPSWIVAAQLVGAIAPSLRNDPGRPVQTLPITGMLAPPTASQFPLSQRNSLLFSGIATFNADQAGVCHVENMITTYQTNAYGSADASYLEIETMYLLAYVLRYMSNLVTSKYGRMKLAANGTRFAAGAAIVTPNILKAEIIAAYQTLEFNGYVQNSKAFAAGLIVEQNATNPNRVDCLWPGTLINQLRIFALLAQFRLQ
jgi:phage tail sheath gpL-like